VSAARNYLRTSVDALGRLDQDRIDWHVLHALFGGGLRVDDDVDHVHAFDHFGEHGITASRPGSRKALSATLMKNWLVAESGFEVRAIDSVPRTLCRPLLASFLIGGLVSFCAICAVNPPPWTMKPGITRWKIVLV